MPPPPWLHLCERAFSHGVRRVCAGVDESNLASARVLRKNGFERDGIDKNGRLRFVKSQKTPLI